MKILFTLLAIAALFTSCGIVQNKCNSEYQTQTATITAINTSLGTKANYIDLSTGERLTAIPKENDLKVGTTYKFIFRLSIIEKNCTVHGMYLLQANEIASTIASATPLIYNNK